jgi:DMSO/TMAO reductase YedYZ molybdopterin-dependent catalytic subunit
MGVADSTWEASPERDGRRPGPPSQPSGTTGTVKPIGRRLFLGLIGAGAVGTVFGDQIQNVVGKVLQPLTNSSGGGLAALIPGADRFRIYTVTGGYPVIVKDRYSLSVGGLVERPLRLSYNDLLALPRTELDRDFQCVTGWRVPEVHWAGARLGDIVDLARPTAAAGAVEFTSYDGVYTESLTMAEAHRSDVIVAYEMFGAPITTEHGGPVRLYVAPMYGYKSAKWLKSITLVKQAIPGFWEQQGYDVDAWVGDSNGRHDAPIP